jgi:UrcA family protein
VLSELIDHLVFIEFNQTPMEMKMTRVLDILSAIGALAMAATPLMAITATAHAAELRPQGVSVAVGDLDFARPADVARFDARVNSAANTICQAKGEVGLQSWSTCRTAVHQEAVQKLDASQRQQMASISASVA